MSKVRSDIIFYQTEDEKIRIEARLEDNTVWLTQAEMSRLFQRERSVITKHINNIFSEGELEEKSNVQILHISGSDKPVKAYSLDVIIAVGYRVKSLNGTRFRIWATQTLKDYIIKGFAMNDDLLKEAGGGVYFDELLARIRDIRSSEKVFWRKVLDIYATSIDYDSRSKLSIKLFKTIQNKIHWAAHGNTAAEVIYKRVDSNKSSLGMTNFKGHKPTKKEVGIAKNYLSKKELDVLNRMVTAYLEIAEIKALERIPMYMEDWIRQLDSFLSMAGKRILSSAGKISHKKAMKKAYEEYDTYQEQTRDELTKIEKDLVKYMSTTSKKIKEHK